MANRLPSVPRLSAATIHPLHDADTGADVGAAYRVPPTLPQQLLAAAALLRRRLWIVLAIAAATVAVAAAKAWRDPAWYRATAVVRLSNERQALSGPLGEQAVAPVGGWQTDERVTELQVLRSRAVAREVVAALGLRLQVRTRGLAGDLLRDVRVAPEAPTQALRLAFSPAGVTVRGARGATAHAAYGRPLAIDGVRFTVAAHPGRDEVELAVVPLDEAAAAVQGTLDGALRDKTDIIDVSYTTTDPLVAQRVVNAAVDAFRALSARAMQQRSVRRRVFLEGQLGRMDAQLAEAQLALNTFRSRQRTFSPQDRFKAQQRDLASLDGRRQELDADRRTYAALLETLQRAPRGATSADGVGALVSSPVIAENPIVVQLLTQLLAYQAARDSLTTGRWASTAGSAEVRRLDTLISGTSGRVVGAVRGQLTATEARIAALDALKARGSAEMAAQPPAEAEEVRLLTGLTTAYRRADQLREEVEKAQMEEAVEAGRVELLDAAPPGVAVGASRRAKLLFGLVLGLALGVGVAYLVDGANTSIRGADELRSELDLYPLALIPRLGGPSGTGVARLPAWLTRGDGGGARAPATALVTVSSPRSVGAEAFRSLRTNLLFSQSVQAVKVLVVTSAYPGEGKSTTSANVAVAFAQQGLRVLLVDCDLRRASVHRLFGLTSQPGLTDLLVREPAPAARSDALDPGATIRRSGIDGLFILPAGALPPNPAELLGGARMRRTLEALAAAYDLVVLDTPPVLAASDAAILGKSADGVLLVVCAGRTDRDAVRQAAGQLTAIGARILGAALNDPDAKIRNGYGGYYQIDYSGQPEAAG